MMKKLLLVLGLIFINASCAFAYSYPRWSTFPINIYIEPNKNAPVVERAFRHWQTNAGSVLKFFYKKSGPFAKNAQIKVYFTEKLSNDSYYDISIGDLYGPITPRYFHQITLTVRTKEPNGKAISSNKLYAISLNAVGSAMGVRCLKSSGNVMSCDTDYTPTRVTKTDITALNRVYRIYRTSKPRSLQQEL